MRSRKSRLMTHVSTNCVADNVVLPLCANPLHCPGLCLVPESGSAFFKRVIAYELERSGMEMTFDEKCKFGRLPWHWLASHRVVRIVRHPVERMLSAYLNQKHTKWASGYSFSHHANFTEVVTTITRLPDAHVHLSFRRQTAMCKVETGDVATRVLRLEEYAHWRLRLAKKLHWPLLLSLVPRNRIGVDVMATFYTPDLLHRVETWAANDMKVFGYTSMFDCFDAEWKRRRSWETSTVTEIEDMLSDDTTT